MDCIVFNGIEYRFFDHIYAVSSCGKFLRNFKHYEPKLRPDGYLSVGRRLLAHRVVASVWLEKPADAHHVHHLNHNKRDNRAINLQWLSRQQHLAEHPEFLQTGKNPKSEATRQKIREARTGSITSETTKQKQREASLRIGSKPPPRAVGTKLAPEVVAKMRLNCGNKQPCEIFGVIYPTMTLAAEALGQKRGTLRKRCLSNNFPDYKLLDS